MQSTVKLSHDFEQIVRSPTVSRPKLLTEIYGKDVPLQNAFETLVTQLKHNAHRRELIGTMLGSYKILSILGVGGMSTVYRAERADGSYSAPVAIKVLEPSHEDSNWHSRLRAERQILASLNHSFIARLLDAGTTRENAAYYVMELVDGDPIDTFCDDRRLSINVRLELFEKICDAVGYAHKNLIVHCDLKPTNILITGDSSPKLLDFGIARILQSIPSELPYRTGLQDRLLTPEFASPEQVLGRSITTASDIYSLGVLLYLILTGQPPYKMTGSQLELERCICVTDPRKPSGLFDSDTSMEEHFAATASRIAGLRSSTPKQLKRMLAGDLDAIVLKALRKEPEHRYASAGQLAEDLRRYRLGKKVSVSSDGIRARATRMLRSTYGQDADAGGKLLRQQYLIPRNSVNRVKELSEKHGVSATEIVRRAVTAYDPESSGVADEEMLTALDNIHAQLKLRLIRVDDELARISKQNLAIEDGSMRSGIRAQVKLWAAQQPDALQSLGDFLARAARTL